ncbi:craniofacial development protein 2-like [Cydia pomonella]|uniref:craniofacial development protein 2-like n=1 Tax=Cydia pomonella TaxID=82600 RepID=UPI002ADD6908|nr:craniofacial development protein 2-like [Cydia pomonella]
MTGRSQELSEILNRRHINICCVQELKWKGSKSRDIGYNYQLLYNGSSTTRNGIGVILDENLKNRIIQINRISDRIMYVKVALDNQPCLNILSVYAPQTGCNREEKEVFWEELQETIQNIPATENKILAGDLNGHIGKASTQGCDMHGGFGYGTLNDQGKEILDLANNFQMPIINSFFEKKNDHLITYKSGKFATQIDYIMSDATLRKYFRDCKVIPGEPLTTQHRLLVACLKLPNWRSKSKIKPRPRIKWFNLDKAKGDDLTVRVGEYLTEDLRDVIF